MPRARIDRDDTDQQTLLGHGYESDNDSIESLSLEERVKRRKGLAQDMRENAEESKHGQSKRGLKILGGVAAIIALAALFMIPGAPLIVTAILATSMVVAAGYTAYQTASGAKSAYDNFQANSTANNLDNENKKDIQRSIDRGQTINYAMGTAEEQAAILATSGNRMTRNYGKYETNFQRTQGAHHESQLQRITLSVDRDVHAEQEGEALDEAKATRSLRQVDRDGRVQLRGLDRDAALSARGAQIPAVRDANAAHATAIAGLNQRIAGLEAQLVHAQAHAHAAYAGPGYGAPAPGYGAPGYGYGAPGYGAPGAPGVHRRG